MLSRFSKFARPVSPAALLSFSLVALSLSSPSAFAADPTTTAAYTLTFDATWSAPTHPTAFPASAHFSGLIGGTHDDTVHFWEVGGMSSPGMENMAETGSKSPLLNEIFTMIPNAAGEIISGAGIFPSPGSAFANFTASVDHPLITVVSMIAPSPDWFVGVDSLELMVNGQWVEQLVVPLAAYDSGTDDGISFTSFDADSQPAQPISLITGFPFSSGVPLGTFTLTRTDTPASPWSDLGGASPGTGGTPTLVGSGQLAAGQTITLSAAGALPLTPAFLIVGTSQLNAPFKGGTLVPSPDVILSGFSSATDGTSTVAAPWPAGIPAGIPIVAQFWFSDTGGVFSFSATNGVCAVTQ
ncbi:MAG: hypothetical protein ACI9EF_001274 [Pseudohongiellaceae bacterium]